MTVEEFDAFLLGLGYISSNGLLTHNTVYRCTWHQGFVSLRPTDGEAYLSQHTPWKFVHHTYEDAVLILTAHKAEVTHDKG